MLGSPALYWGWPGLGIAIDPAGDALVVWPRPEGTTPSGNQLYSLQAALLDAGGPMLHAAYALFRPRIVGVARVGRTITCTRGRWSGAEPIRFSYRWLRKGRPVGARRAYRPTRRDAGALLSCAVTGANAFGPVTAKSTSVRVRR